MGSWLNHAVVSLPYVGSTLFIVVTPSIAGAALGPLALAGSLASVRLVDRRQIGAHLAGATLAAAGVIASGLVDVPMILALALIILVNWGSAGGATIYLERSEEQGEELERLVRRDPLTGVGNRRLLAEQLVVEEQRYAVTGRSFSVLALDLNGFKGLNDSLGHGAGDDLLRDVAEALTAVAGPLDTIVRQGGDEFCLVLPETDPAEAIPAANAARAAVARLSRDGHRITTGVGIATFPTDARNGDVLLYVADERLRIDKESGPPRERRLEPRAEVAPAPLELLDDPPAETGTGG
jgi:diguanylate cyclase (GGDEF)-like protein